MGAYNLTPVRDATDANDDNIGWLLYVQGEHHKPIAIIDDETMRKAVAKWLHLHPVYAKEIATQIHKEVRLERQTAKAKEETNNWSGTFGQGTGLAEPESEDPNGVFDTYS